MDMNGQRCIWRPAKDTRPWCGCYDLYKTFGAADRRGENSCEGSTIEGGMQVLNI
jgi:hypothetical protein